MPEAKSASDVPLKSNIYIYILTLQNIVFIISKRTIEINLKKSLFAALAKPGRYGREFYARLVRNATTLKLKILYRTQISYPLS